MGRPWVLRGGLVAGIAILAVVVGLLAQHGDDRRAAATYPDEPYRLLGAVGTLPPGTAAATVPLRGGVSAAGTTVFTQENAPQFELFVPLGTLHAAASNVTVAAAPVTVANPRGGRVAGNAYEVTLSGGARFSDPQAQSYLLLRTTSATQPAGTIEVLQGGAWRTLASRPSGSDFYRTAFAGPGTYALVVPG